MEKTYRFSSLNGKREDWAPPLSVSLNEFWDRVEGAFAVFIPAHYWRALIKQGNIMDKGLDCLFIAPGNYPVGMNKGVHIYSNAFTGHKPAGGFTKPITIVQHHLKRPKDWIASEIL
ncbi:hypothetical protein YA0089_26670 [Pseudomonas viridiflava]|uniref:hypothetical protein n=1 Tax=Pseudomonas viridiflava TaxID=33069 RepID=UPI0018E6592B|nr:hypothetical protein [Pseudomonas viridiflava]MBI6727202.1 hypothetical protein [Pseudomonas viridiflava]